MKPVLISFAVTAALLSLHVLPSAWSTVPADASGFSERHANEDSERIHAEMLGRDGA